MNGLTQEQMNAIFGNIFEAALTGAPNKMVMHNLVNQATQLLAGMINNKLDEKEKEVKKNDEQSKDK